MAALCSSDFDLFYNSAILRDQKIKGDAGTFYTTNHRVTWCDLTPGSCHSHLGSPSYKEWFLIKGKESPSWPGEGQMQTVTSRDGKQTLALTRCSPGYS